MKRQRLREIDGFFAILVTLVIAQILFLSGVVSGKEEVKRGEKVLIMKNKSLFNIKRVEVYDAGMDCKQQMIEVCKWCSSEEKKKGCTNNNCSSFLLDDGMESVSSTFNASDGCYIVVITGNYVLKKELIVIRQDQLTSAINPEPSSSREPVETKGVEPPEMVIPVWVIIMVIAGVIMVITGVIIFINQRCKKKKKINSDTGDDAGDSEENITLKEGIGGGEPDAGDSLQMDKVLHATDEDRLKKVLIDNGRPGHNHIDDDDDDYYSSINWISDKGDYCNGKNDNDSNYYNNDEST